MPFKKLFQSSPKSSDGLTQAAREAIVDVLHFAMYADKTITIREDEFIERAARTLDWDAKISYEYYEGKSTGAVTRSLSDPLALDAFFESIRTRLPRPADRELALKLANDLALADGQKSSSETAALAKLRAKLAN
jgi:uncharacterized tellurite resistance protein B-like protein